MFDIQVSKLSKFFGEKQVLKDVSFEIRQGEKVGLLGANGAGKTTLFKILTSEYLYDAGEISIAKGKTIAVLDQIPDYPASYTAEDVMRTAFQEIEELKETLRSLENAMSQETEKSEVKRYGELLSRFEALGGYNTSFELDRVANGLKITKELRNRLFSQLSGGEKTRVNLAQILLRQADILLMDEPTNHLDLQACDFLGELLESYKKTVLIISHDRYFLDQVVDRIIEIENGQANFFIGNYSYYAVEKERRINEAMRVYEAQQQEKKRLEAAASKLHAWGTQSVKMHQRAFSIEKRIERMKACERPVSSRAMHFSFGESEYFVEDLVKVKGLSKKYENKSLFDDLNFTIKNGDRIALIGGNGMGKTTLLRLLLGDEKCDSGLIRLDSGLKPAYLPQNIVFQHPSRNLIDTLIYEKNLPTQTARNRLGAFGFSGDDQLKQVSTLSGGEKSRLVLCMLMYDKINMLILDEPTNHLDIPSREWIEDAISAFSGTILFVSHDRYFISRFANRIFELQNNLFTDYKGNYHSYLQSRMLSQTITDQPKTIKQEKQVKKSPLSRGNRSLQRQVNEIEREIEKMELRLAEIDREMEINAANHVLLGELFEEKTLLQSNLNSFMNEWEMLSEQLQ
ncbi:MAG: ABC-F family ATP-binding cassette domain-containing protein [Clostridiales bacterium]|nr:ABC-F family ATP-binding cassette domain-containing protein [Clostridiales bacterium]